MQDGKRGFRGVLFFPAFAAAASLLSGGALAEELSDFTAIDFAADGNLTEFVSLGDGQNYIDLTVPLGPTDGDILAGVTVTPGVLVITDDDPPPGALQRPTGFHDLPGLVCGGDSRIPTGFNIGRVFVSYNGTLDKYFFGIDCSAPFELDPLAGTDPVAFDTDGDGDADSAGEMSPPDDPLEEVPQNQDDFYLVVLDFNSDGTDDLEVHVIERNANSFNAVPGGVTILREYKLCDGGGNDGGVCTNDGNCPGGGSCELISTRFVEVRPAAFQANLTAAAVGSVPGAGDIEFELSSASALPDNTDPFCLTVTAFADTFNDVPCEGGEERLPERFLLFPKPQLECTKLVRCVVGGSGVGSFRVSTQLVPGEDVEFQITLNNTGNLDLGLTTNDVLSCISPAMSNLVGGSCQTPGGLPGGIIADFCAQFEAAMTGGGFPLAIGTLAGPSPDATGCPTGSGESFTFRFQATTGPGDFCDPLDPDPDCTNTVSFLGEATVDNTPFEDEDNPHEFVVTADSECDADLDFVCRDVAFTKEVSASNAGGALDPLALPAEVGAYPIDITYTYTANNNGDFAEDVTVEDADLCSDVAANAGVSLIDCPVCPAGDSGSAPAGGSFATHCTIRISTPTALETFAAKDDARLCTDPGEDCYRNCASATVGAFDPNICDSGADLDAEALICRVQECELTVTKQVRCLPDCSLAGLGPEEGWVTDPAQLDVAPGACLQYRIIVENAGTVAICALNYDDTMTNNGNFASGPDNVDMTGPTTCPNLLGEFNWDGTDVVCPLDPPLAPGQSVTVLFEATVKGPGDVDPALDPVNTVEVKGVSSCPGEFPVDCSGPCCDTSSVAIDVLLCGIEVTKEVKCEDDPDSTYAHDAEAAPGSTLTFRIQVTNTGELDMPLVCITDVLSCESWFVSGSVAANIGVDNVTPCVAPIFEAALGTGTRACYTLPCRLAPGLATGETLTITFDVTVPDDFAVVGIDPDCTNDVMVEGFAEACMPSSDDACDTDNDDAEFNVLIPEMACRKDVCGDLNSDGVCDPAHPFAPAVQMLETELTYPFSLIYRFEVSNPASSEMDLAAQVCDADLVLDAVGAGLIVGPCDLCTGVCDGVDDACVDLGTISPGGSASATCQVRVPSAAAWEAFSDRDGIAGDLCYDNLAEASGQPDVASGVCEGPDLESLERLCGARACVVPGELPPCPPVTKVKVDIWNENEIRFSGTERCIESWDQTLLSDFTGGGINMFWRLLLNTNKGKARIHGIASPVVCGEASVDAPLLGVSAKLLYFDNDEIAMAGMSLVGSGEEAGQLLYDIVEPLPSSDPGDGGVSQPKGQTREPAPLLKVERPAGKVPPGQQSPRGGDEHRASISQKGSLLVFPKVEIKWNHAGVLIQDTFIDLTNDSADDVQVQLYFVDGDGCIWVDNVITLTGNEPTYWSVLTGQPKGVSPFTSLGSGFPDSDPENPGGRRLRGYVVAWAVDQIVNQEIRWDHLKGDAVIVNYQNSYAWEYNAWAFGAVAGVADGDLLLDPFGQLDLDGVEYDYAPSTLLLDFYASGTILASDPAHQVGVDTDLTLWAVLKDLRGEGLIPD